MFRRPLMVVAIPAAIVFGYFAVRAAASGGAESSAFTPSAFTPWKTQPAPESRLRAPKHGGQRLAVEVKLVPAQVRSTAGAESLDMDVELLNTTPEKVKTIVSYEIFSDLGVRVGGKTISPKTDLPEKNHALSTGPGVPGTLADGYYVVNATTAWKGPSVEGTASDYFYFRVREKRIETVSADAWAVDSRVSEGVAQ